MNSSTVPTTNSAIEVMSVASQPASLFGGRGGGGGSRGGGGDEGGGGDHNQQQGDPKPHEDILTD